MNLFLVLLALGLIAVTANGVPACNDDTYQWETGIKTSSLLQTRGAIEKVETANVDEKSARHTNTAASTNACQCKPLWHCPDNFNVPFTIRHTQFGCPQVPCQVGGDRPWCVVTNEGCDEVIGHFEGFVSLNSPGSRVQNQWYSRTTAYCTPEVCDSGHTWQNMCGDDDHRYNDAVVKRCPAGYVPNDVCPVSSGCCVKGKYPVHAHPCTHVCDYDVCTFDVAKPECNQCVACHAAFKGGSNVQQATTGYTSSGGRTCHYNYATASGGETECKAACDAQTGCTEFSLGGGLGCRYALDSKGCCTNVDGADIAQYCTVNEGWNAQGCSDGSCQFYVKEASSLVQTEEYAQLEDDN